MYGREIHSSAGVSTRIKFDSKNLHAMHSFRMSCTIYQVLNIHFLPRIQSSVSRLCFNSSYCKLMFTLLVSWLDGYIFHEYLGKTSYLKQSKLIKVDTSYRDISLNPQCMIFRGLLQKAIVFDSLRFISGFQSGMIYVWERNILNNWWINHK